MGLLVMDANGGVYTGEAAQQLQHAFAKSNSVQTSDTTLQEREKNEPELSSPLKPSRLGYCG